MNQEISFKNLEETFYYPYVEVDDVFFLTCCETEQKLLELAHEKMNWVLDSRIDRESKRAGWLTVEQFREWLGALPEYKDCQ